MVRVPFQVVCAEVARVLGGLGFTAHRAARLAELFAEASRDGVASHGLNRVSRFVGQVRAGIVDPVAEPVRIAAFGAWEQWDGRLGPGPLNAEASTARAMALARDHGLGCVALRNTTHWMRGGAYGWQAALAGCAFVGWTNTTPNMPPWGGRDRRLGNNPLIIGVPRRAEPVVLDMAMSLFSYGRMETAKLRGTRLPLAGGYGADDELTTDPSAILESQRPLPIGYWKGSGLALVLDLMAAVLGGGLTTVEIGRERDEHRLSQVFLAFDVARAGGPDALARVVDAVLADLHAATPVDPRHPVRYPGEGTLQTRAESLRLGVPVDEAVWRAIATS